jgi:CBS domain containing-hemolysin-like protein
MPLDELERLVGHDFEEGDWETLSGLLIATKGGLLQAGESVSVPLIDIESERTDSFTTTRVMQARVINLARRIPAVVVVEIIDQSVSDTESSSSEGQA